MDTASPFIVPTLASSRCWVMTPAKGDGPLPTPAIEPKDSHHLLLSVPSRDPEIFREQLGQGTSITQEKMKKATGLTPAKRWGDFQRQASRRKKSVALTKEECLRLVSALRVLRHERENRCRSCEKY